MTTDPNPVSNPTPGRVVFLDGQGELPMLGITTAWSTAEVYLHGAHVTHFTRKGEPPLLFLSQCSRFTDGQPIRGGVPIIFPWFGMREGMGQHGFARNKDWELKEFAPTADGSVSVKFRLPEYPEASAFPPFSAEYTVTVNQALTLQLVVTNKSPEEVLTLENCLHTYFEIGDITAISVHGLKGVNYFDQVDKFASKIEAEEAIRIASEVDRVYQNTTHTVEIIDPRLRRKIRIEKQGSNSTVVWNPWVRKAQQMQDFGNDEYQRMVCVESGNIGFGLPENNALSLAPGQSHTLEVKLSSETL
jgi:D-hexose-6-phosphate mutarotase